MVCLKDKGSLVKMSAIGHI